MRRLADARTDEAIAATLALWAAGPILENPQATLQTLRDSGPLRPASAGSLPRGMRLRASIDDWRPVTTTARVARRWDQPRRDRIGVELVLAFPLLIDLDEPTTPDYMRRIDVGLEALGASFTGLQLRAEIESQAEELIEESASLLQKVAASELAATGVAVGVQYALAASTVPVPVGIVKSPLRKGQSWAVNAWRKPLKSQALDLTRTLYRIEYCLQAREYPRLNELRYQIDVEKDRLLIALQSGENVDRHQHRIRMVDLARDSVSHMMVQASAGPTPDLAPDLLRMRVKDARLAAHALRVRTRSTDALTTNDFPGRLVLRASRWHVVDQWPPPGYYLAPTRRVQLFVRK